MCRETQSTDWIYFIHVHYSILNRTFHILNNFYSTVHDVPSTKAEGTQSLQSTGKVKFSLYHGMS